MLSPKVQRARPGAWKPPVQDRLHCVTAILSSSGGWGGVFAPSLFVGATSGVAFGEIAGHIFGPAAGQPALYAVVAMDAVFTSAGRAPLTSVASVVEMTGDYTLTLPVMLAVAFARHFPRAVLRHHLHPKLLRRGQDIDRAAPWRAFSDIKAADAMRPFPVPLPVLGGHDHDAKCRRRPGLARGSCPDASSTRVTPRPFTRASHWRRRCAKLQGLRPRRTAGISRNGRQVRGWITNQSVLETVADQIGGSRPLGRRAPLARQLPAVQPDRGEPPAPLHGYRVLEISMGPDSPGRRPAAEQPQLAAGRHPRLDPAASQAPAT